MEWILNRLREGVDFETLAKRHSDSPEDLRGQLQGPVRPGELNPKIEEAIAGLQPGEFSGIVELPHGYQIVFLERRQEGRLLDFEQVKEGIRGRLLRERQAEERAALIRRLEQEFSPVFSPNDSEVLYRIGDDRLTRCDWDRIRQFRGEGESGRAGEESEDLLLTEYYERDLLAEGALREGLETSEGFLKKMEMVGVT
jgi:hypothetical protein